MWCGMNDVCCVVVCCVAMKYGDCIIYTRIASSSAPVSCVSASHDKQASLLGLPLVPAQRSDDVLGPMSRDSAGR